MRYAWTECYSVCGSVIVSKSMDGFDPQVGDLVREDRDQQRVCVVTQVTSSAAVFLRGRAVSLGCTSWVSPPGPPRVGDRVRVKSDACTCGGDCKPVLGCVLPVMAPRPDAAEDAVFVGKKRFMFNRNDVELVAHDEPLAAGEEAPSPITAVPGRDPLNVFTHVTVEHHELVCKTWAKREENAIEERDKASERSGYWQNQANVYLGSRDAARAALDGALDEVTRCRRERDEARKKASERCGGCSLANERGQERDDAIRQRNAERVAKDEARAQLALAEALIERMKLARYETPEKPSRLERARERLVASFRAGEDAGVRTREWVATKARALWGAVLLRRFVLLWLVTYVACVAAARAFNREYPVVLCGDTSEAVAPIGTLVKLVPGMGTSHMSFSLAEAPTGLNLWSLRLAGNQIGSPGHCRRCGHDLAKRNDRFSDEITVEAPLGHVVFDGCVWCLASDIERVDRLRLPESSGLVLERRNVRAGTTLVIDGPIEGLAFVSSGDASVMIERRGR